MVQSPAEQARVQLGQQRFAELQRQYSPTPNVTPVPCVQTIMRTAVLAGAPCRRPGCHNPATMVSGFCSVRCVGGHMTGANVTTPPRLSDNPRHRINRQPLPKPKTFAPPPIAPLPTAALPTPPPMPSAATQCGISDAIAGACPKSLSATAGEYVSACCRGASSCG